MIYVIFAALAVGAGIYIEQHYGARITTLEAAVAKLISEAKAKL
jgi:hypothetical protein